MRIIRTAHVLAIKYAGQAAWTSQKKKRKNTKELENPKKIVKKNVEQEKTRRKQGKNNIEKRIRLCLLPGRVWAGPGLVWPGLAWLGFLPLVFTSFFFFLGQVYADAESRWKEREKEAERSAENGRQTRLEIFARSQWGRERGQGKHVKEQLLKRIYRFIYVFVCAMWVHRYSQLAMERKREGQTHFGMRPKQSEAEKRKQKSVSEGVRRGEAGATFRCGDFDFEIQIPINFPTIWHTMRERAEERG